MTPRKRRCRHPNPEFVAADIEIVADQSFFYEAYWCPCGALGYKRMGGDGEFWKWRYPEEASDGK